ncbi:MAG: uracil-DNA glycosylase [Treponema sp.]|nr:uracil-DNA glycosylase [Treponema sp.]
MTTADKQTVADFLDTTRDFLGGGYKSEKILYNFDKPVQVLKRPALNVDNTQTADSLEKITEEISVCRNCPLANGRKNTVPGEGVKNPVVLVIGEGPGADEDVQGRPFVGKAGQLLDKMLAAIDLSRTTNCFIANVVKCRPPNNRDPFPEERAACSYFLHRQILLLKPKFILLVGNIASQSILKTTEPIGKIRGKFFDYQIDELTIPLIVTYHPSGILRREEFKRPAWEDLKLLKSKIGN